MVSDRRQIVGLALAIIGFLGSVITCGLPVWKVTRIITGIIAPQVMWEGLWMFCAGLPRNYMECKVYNSFSTPSQELQAARALVVIAIIIGVFGVVLGIVGSNCTNFIEDERQKYKVAIAAGAAFITTGLLMIIPICWTASTIIQNSHYMIDDELGLGVSLYIGWGAAGLLFLGGGILCRYETKKLNESFSFSSLKKECAV